MNVKTLDELEAIVYEKPLIVIDAVLQEISQCKENEIDDLLGIFIEAIFSHIEQPVPNDDLSVALFNQGLRQRDKRFVAICLLRLLATNGTVFERDSNFRHRSHVLFDETLSGDLYNSLDIDAREQRYLKIAKLKDIVPDAEFRMQSMIESFRGIDRLDENLAHFMKTINSPNVRAVLLPFLPRSLLYKTRIQDLFDAVRGYRQAIGLNTINAIEHSKDVIDSFIEEARDHETTFSKEYLLKFGTKLKSFLMEDFLNSDFGKPAEITIKLLDKRYPLHNEGKEISIGFEVENIGSGLAFFVEINVRSLFDDLEITRSSQKLGRLAQGSYIVDFPARVAASDRIALLEVKVEWRNADGNRLEQVNTFEVTGQRTDINWDELELEDPYSLEPVESHLELVGRKEILNQLVRQSRSKSMGSAYVYGQKRVGKTSIAKALKSQLSQQENLVVAYLEGGEYIHPKPETTIAQLGQKICKEIVRKNRQLKNLEIPNFEGAIFPLTEFLSEALDQVADFRVLIILDEFDELPIELYKRGPLADAFFLTLRTISGKPPFALILVGGEKMKFIMSCQGDTLNKFQVFTIDYFDQEEHWNDFQELVRKPTREWFDISDEAIVELYTQTAGNPFYTIFICRELFVMMLHRRDSHITSREIKEAISRSLKKIASNGFQHFWEDGIFEPTGDRIEEISMRRRRILIALAQVLRENDICTKNDLAGKDILYSDNDILDIEIRSFIERNVLWENNGYLSCTIPFFQSWLTESGVNEILTTFTEYDAIMERQQKEEEAYVRTDEILELLDKWGLYQGKRISDTEIRNWLSQFGENTDQRLMFKILLKTKFYTNDELRSKMAEAHGIVTRGLGRHKRYRQIKRGDIIVSYLDGPGKSGGGKFTKLYADENSIYYASVVEKSRLTETLQQNAEIQALVFLDDYIGSGGSAVNNLQELDKQIGDVLRQLEIRIYFIAITGFQESQELLESKVEDLNLPINIRICDPLDDSSKCFGARSAFFADETERLRAESIALEKGNLLVKSNPLGFGECQSAIVFPDNCPNNNLPILWAEDKDLPWRPLFKRSISGK